MEPLNQWFVSVSPRLYSATPKLPSSQSANEFQHIMRIYKLLYSLTQQPFLLHSLASYVVVLKYTDLTRGLSSALGSYISMNKQPGICYISLPLVWPVLTHPRAFEVPGTVLAIHLCEVEHTQVFWTYKCMDQNLDSCYPRDSSYVVQFLLHDHFNQNVTTASNHSGLNLYSNIYRSICLLQLIRTGRWLAGTATNTTYLI